MNPALAAECAQIDALLLRLAAHDEPNLDRTLGLARMEGQGVFDRAALPPQLRRPFEDLAFACIVMAQGNHELGRTLIRTCWHTVRTVGRIYEEEKGE